MRDHMLRDKTFIRGLSKLALPIAAQSLMLSAVAVADTLMLGQYQDDMAAVSLATKIQFVQNIAISSFIAALIMLGAQYWGKKDKVSMDKLFGIALRYGGILSILFFIGCEFFPQYLMLIFTDQQVLIDIAVPYLRIAAWSYLITGFSQCYLALLKISNHTGDTATISGTTVVLNIALNAVFIFGLKMNVRGAALATLIARAVELMWAMALSFRKNYIRPSLRHVFSADKLLHRDFVRNLLPLLGAGLLWGVGFTAYSAFMGHIEDAAAANSVASSVIELVCCACNGLASGGGILVGNELGAGHPDTGKLYGNRILRIAWVCGFLTSLAMFAITPLIMSIVHLNDTATGYLKDMMIVMTVYTIGRVINTIIINGIFAAGGDTMFDVYSLAVTMWGIALPLAALGTFVFNWPVWVVYGCTCLDEVGKIPWVIWHFRKYKWVKDLTREGGQA